MIINICGIPHKVEFAKDKFDIDTHFGQIEYAKGVITVNEELKDEMLEETLCHEILHGILVHIGYSELSADEKFVQCLANAINQTFSIGKSMDER